MTMLANASTGDLITNNGQLPYSELFSTKCYSCGSS